jgi:hypothetical protein
MVRYLWGLADMWQLAKIWTVICLLALLYLMAVGLMDRLEQRAEQCRTVHCT